VILLAMGFAGCGWFQEKPPTPAFVAGTITIPSEYDCPPERKECFGIISTAKPDSLNGYAEYAMAEGTSFATPLVSAAAALMLGRGVPPEEVPNLLKSSAREIGEGSSRHFYYGAGLLDIAAALHVGRAPAPPQALYLLLNLEPYSGGNKQQSGFFSSLFAAEEPLGAATGSGESRLIVKPAPGREEDLLAYLAGYGIQVRKEARVWLLDGRQDWQELADTLVAGGYIDYYTVSYPVEALGAVDPLAAYQWGMVYSGFDLLWEALDAGTIAVEKTTVAVLDTGVKRNHPDLAGVEFVPGCSLVPANKTGDDPPPEFDGPFDMENPGRYCEDQVADDVNGHGTLVSGLIAAGRGNGIGIAGAAAGLVRLMPVRVLDYSGHGNSITLAWGIYYAVLNGADVINLSLGQEHRWGLSPTLQAAIDFALERGVVVVAAAGNTGAAELHWPAAYDPVLSVGAITLWGNRAHFSNYGQNLDLVAPGGGYPEIIVMADAEPATGHIIKPHAKYTAYKQRQFQLQVTSGPVYLYAWIDANFDGRINRGDYFAYQKLMLEAWEKRNDLVMALQPYEGETVYVLY